MFSSSSTIFSKVSRSVAGAAAAVAGPALDNNLYKKFIFYHKK
jgi:hypothetical protein